MVEFRDRYFAEALPAFRRHDLRSVQRIAKALYPSTLADKATLAATDATLAATDRADVVAGVLLDQRTLLCRAMTARSTGNRAIP